MDNADDSLSYPPENCPLGEQLRQSYSQSLCNTNKDKCEQLNCCDVLKCDTNDGVIRIYNGGGFSKELCEAGEIRKPQVSGPLCVNPATLCTHEHCCEAMYCSNNNGVDHTYAETRFQSETCKANYMLKAAEDIYGEVMVDPSTLRCLGDKCENDDCCTSITCANNDMAPYIYSRTGFDAAKCRQMISEDIGLRPGAHSIPLPCYGVSCSAIHCCAVPVCSSFPSAGCAAGTILNEEIAPSITCEIDEERDTVICSSERCCMAPTCGSNDKVYDVYAANGYQSCSPGQQRIPEQDSDETECTDTNADGEKRCKDSDCCEPLTCAINNGIFGVKDTNGFVCTFGWQDKPADKNTLSCLKDSRKCELDDCCDAINCGNNNGKEGKKYADDGFLQESCDPGKYIKASKDDILCSDHSTINDDNPVEICTSNVCCQYATCLEEVKPQSMGIYVTVHSSEIYMDGVARKTINLLPETTYQFVVQDETNAGHVLKFSTTIDGTHGNGTAYASGIVVSGTGGNPGARILFMVPKDAPSILYYYCENHPSMGGQITIGEPFRLEAHRCTAATHIPKILFNTRQCGTAATESSTPPFCDDDTCCIQRTCAKNSTTYDSETGLYTHVEYQCQEFSHLDSSLGNAPLPTSEVESTCCLPDSIACKNNNGIKDSYNRTGFHCPDSYQRQMHSDSFLCEGNICSRDRCCEALVILIMFLQITMNLPSGGLDDLRVSEAFTKPIITTFKSKLSTIPERGETSIPADSTGIDLIKSAYSGSADLIFVKIETVIPVVPGLGQLPPETVRSNVQTDMDTNIDRLNFASQIQSALSGTGFSVTTLVKRCKNYSPNPTDEPSTTGYVCSDPGKIRDHDNKDENVCIADVCDDEQCCMDRTCKNSEILYSGGSGYAYIQFDCGFAHLYNDDENNEICPGSTCDTDRCCIAKRCDNYNNVGSELATATGGFICEHEYEVRFSPNNDTEECVSGACSSSLCCTLRKCINYANTDIYVPTGFVCGNQNLRNTDNDDLQCTLSGGKICAAEVCCMAKTCGNYNNLDVDYPGLEAGSVVTKAERDLSGYRCRSSSNVRMPYALSIPCGTACNDPTCCVRKNCSNTNNTFFTDEFGIVFAEYMNYPNDRSLGSDHLNLKNGGYECPSNSFRRSDIITTPCSGGPATALNSLCLFTDCCTPMTCGNSFGNASQRYADIIVGGGFPIDRCDRGYLLKDDTDAREAHAGNSEVTGFSSIPCAGGTNGRTCTSDECCIRMVCGNNKGPKFGLQNSKSGFDKDSCAEYTQPYENIGDSMKPCNTSAESCTSDDCCTQITCGNNNRLSRTHGPDGFKCAINTMPSFGTNPDGGVGQEFNYLRACYSAVDRCLNEDCCEEMFCWNNDGLYQNKNMDGFPPSGTENSCWESYKVSRRDDWLTTKCYGTECSAAECCEVPTCKTSFHTIRCLNPNFLVAEATAASLVCPDQTCTSDFCCTATSCSNNNGVKRESNLVGFICPRGMLRFPGSDNVTCADATCKASDCCTPQTCKNNNALLQEYDPHGFQSAKCLPPGNRQRKNPEFAHTYPCPNETCTADDCCEQVHCGNNNGVLGKYSENGFLIATCTSRMHLRLNLDTIFCDNFNNDIISPGTCDKGVCCTERTCANTNHDGFSDKIIQKNGFVCADMATIRNRPNDHKACGDKGYCDASDCCVARRCDNSDANGDFNEFGYICGANYIRNHDKDSYACGSVACSPGDCCHRKRCDTYNNEIEIAAHFGGIYNPLGYDCGMKYMRDPGKPEDPCGAECTISKCCIRRACGNFNNKEKTISATRTIIADRVPESVTSNVERIGVGKYQGLGFECRGALLIHPDLYTLACSEDEGRSCNVEKCCTAKTCGNYANNGESGKNAHDLAGFRECGDKKVVDYTKADVPCGEYCDDIKCCKDRICSINDGTVGGDFGLVIDTATGELTLRDKTLDNPFPARLCGDGMQLKNNFGDSVCSAVRLRCDKGDCCEDMYCGFNDGLIQAYSTSPFDRCADGTQLKPNPELHRCKLENVCTSGECCEDSTCANNDRDRQGVLRYNTPFSKDSCDLGQVLKPDAASLPVTCNDLFNGCTSARCCMPMNCGNNNGIDHLYDKIGFSYTSCPSQKLRIGIDKEDIPCTGVKACAYTNCCELLTCGRIPVEQITTDPDTGEIITTSVNTFFPGTSCDQFQLVNEDTADGLECNTATNFESGQPMCVKERCCEEQTCLTNNGEAYVFNSEGFICPLITQRKEGAGDKCDGTDGCEAGDCCESPRCNNNAGVNPNYQEGVTATPHTPMNIRNGDGFKCPNHKQRPPDFETKGICPNGICDDVYCCIPVNCGNNQGTFQVYVFQGFANENSCDGDEELKDNHKTISCPTGTCTKQRCCIPRTCRNTRQHSISGGGFSVTQCPNSYQLLKEEVYKTKRCETKDGRGCLFDDCCEELTCKNNDGVSGRVYSENGGFQPETCGSHYQPKEQAKENILCLLNPTQSVCTFRDCCEEISCANNNGVSRQFAPTPGFDEATCVADGVPIRDARPKCTSENTRCTKFDCCDYTTCTNPVLFTGCTDHGTIVNENKAIQGFDKETCCEPLSCANSNGGTTFSPDGYNCPAGYMIRSEDDGLSREERICEYGDPCEVLFCCEYLVCGKNNRGDRNSIDFAHVQGGFVCPTGYIKKDDSSWDQIWCEALPICDKNKCCDEITCKNMLSPVDITDPETGITTTELISTGAGDLCVSNG